MTEHVGKRVKIRETKGRFYKYVLRAKGWKYKNRISRRKARKSIAAIKAHQREETFWLKAEYSNGISIAVKLKSPKGWTEDQKKSMAYDLIQEEWGQNETVFVSDEVTHHKPVADYYYTDLQ